MKFRYQAILALLIIGAVVYTLYIWDRIPCEVFGSASPSFSLGDLLLGLGIFVALFAGVVALSIADSKKQFVKIKIETGIDEDSREEYDEMQFTANLSKELKHTPRPLISHRVNFKILNNSSFTFKEPTVTFELPPEKRHPSGAVVVNHGRGIIRTFKNKMDFHSNLYNNREADILESAGQIFISNSNLPYFNIKDSLNIWIRMLIGGPRMKPFNIKVSVNCKNAEGITKKIRINPNRMLKTEEENPDRMLNSKEES